ncbi:hypothetical protein [Paenibacillus ginsengihumi]|uniref:hypothetical protein n=1 Tax=Paenibacillus ginsengihumi TaxID=431596 RepID=UPI00037CC4D3|nr:hypothetical protein [Paenibacillus ginsengihumi]
MVPINPISEETCRPHYGKPVCVILRDGTEIVGILSRVHEGSLILNEEDGVDKADTMKTRNGKSLPAKGRGKKTAGTQAKASVNAVPFFGAGPGFGGPLTLDLGLVALLFLL